MLINLFLETYVGFEDILKKELLIKYNLTNAKTLFDGFVSVFCDLNTLIKMCYSIQSATEIGVLQHIGKIEDYKDNNQFYNKSIMISSHIKIERERKIKELYSKLNQVKTDMKNPDYEIFFNELSVDEYIIGYKLIKNYDFKKRSYKIYLSQQSLSGPLATLTLLLEEEILFSQNTQIGFFFPKDGVLPIECASLLTNKSVRFFDKQKIIQAFVKSIENTEISSNLLQEIFDDYDKLIKSSKEIFVIDVDPKDLNLTEKNAIIGDLKNNINFSRIDLDFWDYKYEKDFYDLIVAYPKFFNKFTKEKIMNKLLDSYFFQFEYILKKKGKLLMILKSDIEEKIKFYSEKYKFTYTSISFGRNDANLYLFKR